MDLHAYQERAAKTDRNPERSEKGMTIPLLGIAGEAGELLSEYKQYLRDGDSHTLFKERFCEELGDILWYLRTPPPSSVWTSRTWPRRIWPSAKGDGGRCPSGSRSTPAVPITSVSPGDS